MSVYHQMGEKSHSLIFEPGLSRFRGAILSPVNDDLYSLHKLMNRVKDRPQFEMIFDPQLYVPRSNRGKLSQWDYFPNDVDTADLSSLAWWQNVSASLVAACDDLGISSLCSPAIIPNRFDNDHFNLTVKTGKLLHKELSGTKVKALQTAVVGLAELTNPSRVLEIASILSRTETDRIYLVLLSDLEPRRELSDADQISGAMRLISALERADISVLVGYSSYDLVLWKAAGASHCATGKFFNLRRFTKSRFEEPKEGGSQLAYWFEEGLLALLRETDILRVQNTGVMSEASNRNPFSVKIRAQIESQPGEPWIGLGWRQYLYGVADLEHRICTDRVDIRSSLREAESKWQLLEDADVLMEERRNDGQWLRAWRRALAEYQR